MKLIQTADVEGTVLYHGITQITKEVAKDAIFRKGHVITREGIPVPSGVGKNQLYVWEKEGGVLHKNDAAGTLCDMCRRQHMERSQAKEGKIELTAVCNGLLGVGSRGLKAASGFGQMTIATRHDNFAVKKRDKLAETRIIPPVTEEEKMETAKKAVAEATEGCPILELKLFLHKKVDIVTTGNEVFCGRIKDTFTPAIQGELPESGTEITDHVTWSDNGTKVAASTLDMMQKGADVVVCTGSMSVDPDDKTPSAIHNTGADITSYSVPALPGAMFLPAYYQVKDGENPRTAAIMGFPGCVMCARRTIFGPVLPRTMADDQMTADDLAALGRGGLYLDCPECTFPNYGPSRGV